MNRFHVFFRIVAFDVGVFPSIATAYSHRAVDIYFATVTNGLERGNIR